MSFGDLSFAGTHICKMRKTQVNTEEMHIISCTCVSLRRRAHKPDEMGVPSKMHPRIKIRAPVSVV